MSSRSLKQTKSKPHTRRMPSNSVNPIMKPDPSTNASNRNQPYSIQLRSMTKQMKKVKEATEINENSTASTKMDCQPSCSKSYADENVGILSLPSVVGTSLTSRPCPCPRLRVLSLFDGIGTGYFALTELGFDIEVYYASEIDPKALLLTKSRFANNIKQLGSVIDIDEEVLKKIGPINLLIGGSPCSELSCVNPLKKGLFDPTGTGILFFEYYRILDILKKKSVIEKHDFFWLFENVKNMENKNRDIISQFLDCKPCVINSLHLSAQRRERYFWSNLADIEKHRFDKDEKNVGPLLDEYLDKNLSRKANVDKICTITTKRSCLQDGKSKNPVQQDGVNSGLFITEIEQIFGFPCHFTDVGNMNHRQRQKLLGKAWSVQVVKKIFQSLNEYFALK